MDEELTIQVHKQVPADKQPSFVETINTLVLAGIGIMAQTSEETASLMQRLRERGVEAQQDSEKLVTLAVQRLQPQNPLQGNDLQIGQGLAQFLQRLNIPSKQDIDELNTRIAQLNARIEALQGKDERKEQ